MRLRRVGERLTVWTPAKLNLFLDVLGKREDGFHELETLMVALDLCDTLHLQNAPGGRLALSVSADSTESIPADGSNLILKAAELLRKYSGQDFGATIHIHKRIPSQAGLGGGSSNAAGALVGLNRLWNAGLSSTELHELAAQLGSDINFFIDSPRAAVCRGRGEQVTPVPCPFRFHVVVVKPDSGLSTAKVFGNLSHLESQCSVESISSALQGARLECISSGLYNALETVSRELNDDVNRLLSVMESVQPLGAMMSGSGTACFAFARHRREALRIAAILRGRFGWRVFPTQLHC